MIKTIETFLFQHELTSTNSYPMLFTCTTEEGFAQYYVKYIQDQSEFDCLAYEFVCHRLAQHFKITTPDVALVKAIENSYRPSDLKYNNTYFKPGVTAFGSKFVDYSILLKKHVTVPDKHTFNLYTKPSDLIRIAIFDLHTDNRDRSEENFNLLMTTTKPSKMYAIDHFYCFGGRMNIGNFHPKIPINLGNSIVRSDFCRQFVSYLDIQDIIDTIEDYYYLCNPAILNGLVDNVISSLPNDWDLSQGLSDRIKAFITDTNRLNSICEQIEYIVCFSKR